MCKRVKIGDVNKSNCARRLRGTIWSLVLTAAGACGVWGGKQIVLAEHSAQAEALRAMHMTLEKSQHEVAQLRVRTAGDRRHAAKDLRQTRYAPHCALSRTCQVLDGT